VCSLFLVLKMDGQSHSKLSHLGLLHRDILERGICRGGIAAEGDDCREGYLQRGNSRRGG